MAAREHFMGPFVVISMAASSILNTVARANQWFIPRWQRWPSPEQERTANCNELSGFVSISLAGDPEYDEQKWEGAESLVSSRPIPVHLTGRRCHIVMAVHYEEECTGHIQPEHEPAASATFRQPCL
ncbi:hypothetical protein NEUTE2DRAFT_75596 [Neurospora tetrasperma FGSC 2509]|nr:hypothetical protein NEUTE2DRAFT_75596 [Neurospora tetrasperma FGSC 2509]